MLPAAWVFVALVCSPAGHIAPFDRAWLCRKVNYRTSPDWAAALLTATDGIGADIVIETGGLATLSQSITAAEARGRVAIVGAMAGNSVDGLPK